ncbi:MAG: hypothetical protein AAGJ82_10710, partial [Bacteroidota bacterium]
VASFDSSELRIMDVLGNAQTVYYPLDEEGGYIGVNSTICSEMRLFFGNNTITRLRFETAPEGKLEPMGAVNHKEIRLEGFDWQTESRPKSLDDLFGPPLRVLPERKTTTATPRAARPRATAPAESPPAAPSGRRGKN